jgi:hypothetical protein
MSSEYFFNFRRRKKCRKGQDMVNKKGAVKLLPFFCQNVLNYNGRLISCGISVLVKLAVFSMATKLQHLHLRRKLHTKPLHSTSVLAIVGLLLALVPIFHFQFFVMVQINAPKFLNLLHLQISFYHILEVFW